MIREFKMEVRVNQNPKVLFWKKKGESVTADYAGSASADGYDIKLVGIRETGQTGNEYLRFSFTVSKGATKIWWNGRLFDNTRRVEGSRQPNYTGDVQLDRNDPAQRLRLAAWIRFDDPKDESTAYLSLDVSEFRQTASAQSSAASASTNAADSEAPI
ncbi:hypothetical protein KDW40_01685 [Burkholderia cenocepacia]|uniref:hypothetical protein n=1 Tax=Burkholderia cenocepacia TaxID=95486 RepID=UPI001B9D3A10|nr:hypothetical protein [Burkholderia cenocepacia]MBR8043190.1 hypothetical protein [Burkholderia cenocepacia]MBR8324440.1 hypothetical protein [Burkholderia cenocepacia]